MDTLPYLLLLRGFNVYVNRYKTELWCYYDAEFGTTFFYFDEIYLYKLEFNYSEYSNMFKDYWKRPQSKLPTAK